MIWPRQQNESKSRKATGQKGSTTKQNSAFGPWSFYDHKTIPIIKLSTHFTARVEMMEEWKSQPESYTPTRPKAKSKSEQNHSPATPTLKQNTHTQNVKENYEIVYQILRSVFILCHLIYFCVCSIDTSCCLTIFMLWICVFDILLLFWEEKDEEIFSFHFYTKLSIPKEKWGIRHFAVVSMF